jgi:A/G-specific adenine glycosylase
MLTEISRLLLEWYRLQARQLPWRGQNDPYATWVSEIMLQQTRVDTVIPYYQRWMERFPTLEKVAAASEQDVLAAWEGLGYYSRARNLHHAACQVINKYQGVIPKERSTLESLPGIGRYSAGAITSIAFSQDEAALDGNIRRVLARLFNMGEPAYSGAGERRLWELAYQNLPSGHAGDYNQALMDLGATLCMPHAPACLVCPLVEVCLARRLGTQEKLPVLKAHAPIPHYTVTAAVIRRGSQVLIARRPSKGLLGGLWEFPGGKVEPGEELPAGLLREIREELGTDVLVGEAFGVYKHAYTHFRVTLHAFISSLNGEEPQPLEASELRWVALQDLAQFPMGKIDRQISRRLEKSAAKPALW